jgi:drug/metabolite transporter (DMT)-like permease
VVIAWSYVLSLVALVYFVPGQRLVPPPGAALAWWSLAYIVAFPTVLAYLLNVFALARLSASTTAVYVYFQPLVTGIASWIVLGERPATALLVSAAALFTGLWLVVRGDRRTRTGADPAAARRSPGRVAPDHPAASDGDPGRTDGR